MSEPAVIVRPDDAGKVDEIIAENCAIHIERMDGSGWFIGITAADGSWWQFWLGARNYRSRVEVRHTETTPADPTPLPRPQEAGSEGTAG